MRNFIFIAVFVAIFTAIAGNTSYSAPIMELDQIVDEMEPEKVSTFEEFQTRHDEVMAIIGNGIISAQQLEVAIVTDYKLLKELRAQQSAITAKKWLDEVKEGREEYRKAIAMYFSSN